MRTSKRKQKKSPRFTVGYAVRIWVEQEVEAESMAQALEIGRETPVGDLIDVNDRITVTNSYCDVMQVFDMKMLNKIS